MKKLIALLLAAVMIAALLFCGCAEEKEPETALTPQQDSQGQNTENTSNENQQTETASQGNGNPEC